jgi:hypothetical protein
VAEAGAQRRTDNATREFLKALLRLTTQQGFKDMRMPLRAGVDMQTGQTIDERTPEEKAINVAASLRLMPDLLDILLTSADLVGGMNHVRTLFSDAVELVNGNVDITAFEATARSAFDHANHAVCRHPDATAYVVHIVSTAIDRDDPSGLKRGGVLPSEDDFRSAARLFPRVALIDVQPAAAALAVVQFRRMILEVFRLARLGRPFEELAPIQARCLTDLNVWLSVNALVTRNRWIASMSRHDYLKFGFGEPRIAVRNGAVIEAVAEVWCADI